jgi:hypothetical protein
MGYNVVLLGLFNGQKRGGNVNEFLVRANTNCVENGSLDSTAPPPLPLDAPQPPSAAGRSQPTPLKVLTRVSPDEYIKCVVSGGRVVGCMIVGESDLEETMENIMLSQINVDALGFDLLDDEVDIEDFFD